MPDDEQAFGWLPEQGGENGSSAPRIHTQHSRERGPDLGSFSDAILPDPATSSLRYPINRNRSLLSVL